MMPVTIFRRLKLRRYAMRISNLLFRSCENFHRTRGGIRAGSLAYILLLSFIPFTISMMSITSWLPFSNSLISIAENEIFKTFLPHTSLGIYKQVKTFLQQSHHLSVFGFVFLLVTTYTMLFSIEKHINELWQNKHKSNFLSSILVDSLFITIGPLFICSIVYLRVKCFPYIYSGSVNNFISHVLTNTVIIIFFICVYKFIPSKKVALSHALVAGIIAGTCFWIIKKIFIFYSNSFFANYSLLYGSVAFIPLFLIWIYLCSLNLLFCAEIIYVLESRPSKSTHLKFCKILEIPFLPQQKYQQWQKKTRS